MALRRCNGGVPSVAAGQDFSFAETVGRSGLAGIHLVEASKQIYAGAGRVRADRVPGRRIFVNAPAPG